MRIRYKVIILLLLPIFILVVGALFGIPHYRLAAFLVFLFYVLLGNFYGQDWFNKNR